MNKEEFKRQFMISFLSSYMYNIYMGSGIDDGRVGEYATAVIEDANVVADKIWDANISLLEK